MSRQAVEGLMGQWVLAAKSEDAIGKPWTYEGLAEELGRHALTLEVMDLDGKLGFRPVTEAFDVLEEIGIVVARLAIRLCDSQGEYTRQKTKKRRVSKC